MQPTLYPKLRNVPKLCSHKTLFLCLLLFVSYTSRACYADFTYTNGCVGDTVFFHALDGSAAYSWDYGDTASGAANVSHDLDGYHVYTAPGDYYVTLFVNIGAEWDYRTNVVHIGSDCFAADFQSTCYSNLGVTFTDYSTGLHTSQLWNFGDPASGVADTSSAFNPYHQFTAEGNYVITYIISDGLQNDTITRSINVDSTCLAAYVGNFTAALNCVNDTVTIYSSFSNDVTFIGWDFGDPASGIANYSNDVSPVHQYSAAGMYIVTLVYGNSQYLDTIYKALPVMDCSVWPGDVNADGEVNAEDIFGIGMFYGDTGTQRAGASQNWTGQACNSWSSLNFAWMYMQDLVDKKMADCNGDGTINASDVQAITNNFGKRHANHNNRSAILFHSPNDPSLMAAVANNSVTAGSDIVVTLSLGSSAVPLQNIYGGSLTLLYDPSKVDAAAVVNFTMGWFDTTGNSLITLSHNDYANGRLEISFVKTNKNSSSGYGNIGTVTFHTKNTAMGAFDIGIDGTAKIFNTNQWNNSFGGNQEVFKNLYLQGTSATIINPLSVQKFSNFNLSVYPNPASSLLYIQHEETANGLHAELRTNIGELVSSLSLANSPKKESIDISALPAGFYILSVKETTGAVIQSERILISH